MYREKITMHYHLVYGDASEVACEFGSFEFDTDISDKYIIAWNDPKHFYEWDRELFDSYSDMMEALKTFP